MLALNVTTGSAALAAGIIVLVHAARTRRPTAPAVFATLTAASWLVHHVANGSPEAAWTSWARWAGALGLVAAAAALVADCRSRERRTLMAAATLGFAVAILLFAGRGPQDVGSLAEAARVAGRASRDIAMGAFVFALVAFAAGKERPALSFALLVYPGIVLGIYLHPASERNVLALAAGMVVVAALWLRQTWTEKGVDARTAAAIVLLAFALPLIGLATVRLQGGFEAATEGAVRAVALAAGPLMYAVLRVRGASDAADLR